MIAHGPHTLAIVWQPAIAPAGVIVIAATLAALAIVSHLRGAVAWTWRGAVPLALRLAIIAVIALVLMGPSSVRPAETPGRGKLVVMLDVSGSMATNDCGGRSRIEHALSRWLTPAQLAAARERFDVALVGVDAAASPLNDADLRKPGDKLAVGGESLLSAALNQAIMSVQAADAADAPSTSKSPSSAPAPTSVLLISDGDDTHNRRVSGQAGLALARGVRVNTVSLGDPRGRPMLSVDALATPGVLLEGQEGRVAVTLHQTGLDGKRVSVRLRGPLDEQARDTAPAARGGDMALSFPVRHDREGSFEYRVIAETTAADGTPVVAETPVFLDVTGRPIRVLLIEGQPGWDTSFLGAALRRDERLRVSQVVSLMPDKPPSVMVAGDEPAPRLASVDDWSAFDLVVLGRDVERVLKADQAADLVEYVDRRGGQVILARGRPAGGAGLGHSAAVAAALAKLEPVIEATQRDATGVLVATTDGLAHPALRALATQASLQSIFSKLPPARASFVIDRLKPAADPLLRFGADGPAALTTMSVGRGGVAMVAVENTWRWSLLTPEQRRVPGLVGAYDQFWAGLARWMVMRGDFEPGRQATLRLGGNAVNTGEAIGVEVACRWTPSATYAPRLTAIDPRGKSSAVALTRVPGADARWHGAVTPAEPGVYKVSLEAAPLTPATQERRFHARRVELERLHSAADPEAMRELAERTTGLALADKDAADWPTRLAASYASRKAPDTIEPVWPRAWLLVSLVALMGAEWIVRRRLEWL